MRRHALRDLLGPFVGVEKLNVEVDDRFAGNAESKMARLDDSCMHRTNRDLKDSLTLYALEFKRSLDPGNCGGGVYILQHRMMIFRPIRM